MSQDTLEVTAVVMGKLPEPGRVKTRLVPPLTFEQAAGVHGLFLQFTLGRLEELRAREVVGGVVFCFDPPDAAEAAEREYGNPYGDWPFLLPQSGGDLGDRLVAACDATGGPALLMGCDSPDVPDEHIGAAAALLRQGRDLVVGPCDDGGFWCLGVAGEVDLRPVVAGVEWSSGRELAQVRANAAAAGLEVADAPPWSDVDRPEDLATLWNRLPTSAAGRGLTTGLLRLMPPALLQQAEAMKNSSRRRTPDTKPP